MSARRETAPVFNITINGVPGITDDVMNRQIVPKLRDIIRRSGGGI